MNFNKIVEFSGIKDFIDTPVKHYSSGMQVRLAFSLPFTERVSLVFTDPRNDDRRRQDSCLAAVADGRRSRDLDDRVAGRGDRRAHSFPQRGSFPAASRFGS